MDSLLNNLRYLDRKSFFYLNDFARHHYFWRQFFYFFAEYGIILIILCLIYLVYKHRINAFFAATLSMIVSTFVSFAIYLFLQRPRPYVTYAEVNKFALHTSVNSFPSGHTFLAFAIATTVLLYGHKKLGILFYAVAILTAISRVAAGVHYPSDVIGGALVGIISGILAYWMMESFEKFWEENSAE